MAGLSRKSSSLQVLRANTDKVVSNRQLTLKSRKPEPELKNFRIWDCCPFNFVDFKCNWKESEVLKRRAAQPNLLGLSLFHTKLYITSTQAYLSNMVRENGIFISFTLSAIENFSFWTIIATFHRQYPAFLLFTRLVFSPAEARSQRHGARLPCLHRVPQKRRVGLHVGTGDAFDEGHSVEKLVNLNIETMDFDLVDKICTTASNSGVGGLIDLSWFMFLQVMHSRLMIAFPLQVPPEDYQDSRRFQWNCSFVRAPISLEQARSRVCSVRFTPWKKIAHWHTVYHQKTHSLKPLGIALERFHVLLFRRLQDK